MEKQLRICKKHGEVVHFARPDGGWRCRPCESERIAERRRHVKRVLVAEHGGRCVRCGYDRCIDALHFHHRDPAQKEFGIAAKGMTYSMDRLRKEATKCDLLCANCHTEAESILVGG